MAKLNISTANSRKKNRHYIPTTTLITQDVAQITPINIIPTTPGDVFNIDLYQQSQSVPTAVKTFGSFHLRSFAFFVPHRVVFPKIEDYIARSVDSSIDMVFRTMSVYDIMETLVGYYVNSETGAVTCSGSKYVVRSSIVTEVPDIWIQDAGENGAWRFNSLGRLIYKTLTGLGYEIPLYITSANRSVLESMEFDMLPLLSFARCFYDWVYPSSYVNQQGFAYLFDNTLEEHHSAYEVFSKLLDLLFVPMEQDFFTSLWLRPNSRALGSQDNITHRTNPDSLGRSVQQLNVSTSDAVGGAALSDTIVQPATPDTYSSLSASSLRWLESLSDFVIRNNIGGQRFHEWMKAHFGFVTAPQDANRSIFLKSWNDTLNFSGVVANTGTDSQLLGDRAGIGNSQGSGKLKFEAKEHGFLIFASMVVPSTAYYQGTKPWCRPINSPFDFYTPELDSVDMEPVPYSAVFSAYSDPNESSALPASRQNDAFGFCPRYAEKYKVGHDFLLGDFRLPSRRVGKDAYHTFRNVLYNRTAQHQLALDAEFLQADNQYNRIYAAAPELVSGSAGFDKIETLYLFNIVKYSSALSIGDSMPIFNRSGRDVTLENGGTQL